ncbi:Uncharacterised protein [Burkholderia pseudomallei]|nr:Uncharacterised protein [Burkholderia pseudomallei]
MVAGVVLWVALAVIFPTVVVPAAQHALERTIKQHDAGASAPGAPRGGTPGQSASPGGGEAIEPWRTPAATESHRPHGRRAANGGGANA